MIKTGTLESSDCMIELQESDSRIIEIDSVVFEQFGDQINDLIRSLLDEHNIKNIHVRCIDKGALDYTIKARLKAALNKWGEMNA